MKEERCPTDGGKGRKRAGKLGFWVVFLSQSRDGQVSQAKQGRRCPPRAFRWSEDDECLLFRRWNPWSALWALPCCRNRQVPEEGRPSRMNLRGRRRRKPSAKAFIKLILGYFSPRTGSPNDDC